MLLLGQVICFSSQYKLPLPLISCLSAKYIKDSAEAPGSSEFVVHLYVEWKNRKGSVIFMAR